MWTHQVRASWNWLFGLSSVHCLGWDICLHPPPHHGEVHNTMLLQVMGSSWASLFCDLILIRNSQWFSDYGVITESYICFVFTLTDVPLAWILLQTLQVLHCLPLSGCEDSLLASSKRKYLKKILSFKNNFVWNMWYPNYLLIFFSVTRLPNPMNKKCWHYARWLSVSLVRKQLFQYSGVFS